MSAHAIPDLVLPCLDQVRKPKSWDGTMRFGIFWPGTRTLLPSAQISALNPDPLRLENHLALAQACEAVQLDFTLLGDGYAPSSEEGTRIGFQDPGLHALMLAAPLLMATRHLGVISTLHTTFFHPTHIARFAANLDWLGGGRWGWNIVNGYRDYEASLFGFEDLPDSSTMYAAAEETIAIMDSLWDGSRRTEHAGAHYRAHGRMKGPYPSERPVYVCAAASEAGRRFTAGHCDYMFASPRSLADVVSIKADLARYAAEAGRDRAPEALVVADLLIRDEPGEAKALYGELMASLDNEAGRKWTGQIGKLRHEKTAPLEFPVFAGTPAEVAEEIIAANKQFGLNGLLFRLPVWSSAELLRAAPIFPILERAGVWRRPASRRHSW
ncbi:LLM class flavin-dependent oxidoreductase [Methylobacterium aquaticum]|nr:LLM class flavin-dependent oxidoreductase [Methylobacterium aquaticum]